MNNFSISQCNTHSSYSPPSAFFLFFTQFSIIAIITLKMVSDICGALMPTKTNFILKSAQLSSHYILIPCILQRRVYQSFTKVRSYYTSLYQVSYIAYIYLYDISSLYAYHPSICYTYYRMETYTIFTHTFCFSLFMLTRV